MFSKCSAIMLVLVLPGCASAYPPSEFALRPVRVVMRPALAVDVPRTPVAAHPPMMILRAPPEMLALSQANTYAIQVQFEGQYDDGNYTCRLRLNDAPAVDLPFTWRAPASSEAGADAQGAMVQAALKALGPIAPGDHLVTAYLVRDGRLVYEAGEPRAAAARFRVVRDQEAGAQASASYAFGVDVCPGGCSTLDGDGDGTADDYDVCPTEQEDGERLRGRRWLP